MSANEAAAAAAGLLRQSEVGSFCQTSFRGAGNKVPAGHYRPRYKRRSGPYVGVTRRILRVR